jgi:hypothetical protein
MTNSFPLKWPVGRPVTNQYNRKDAAFDTTMGRARDQLLHELKLLGARNVVISSNVATYTRGGQEIMYADQSAAKDEPGVAVYYQWNNESYALACDRWKTVTDNLQALNKSVNAIRGLDRWGTGDMVKAAFQGFKELPEPALEKPWWHVLGMPSAIKDAGLIRQYYTHKAKICHPDAGGTHAAMTELTAAYREGLEYTKQ